MLATEAARRHRPELRSCLFHLLGPVRDKRAEGAGARTLFGLLTAHRAACRPRPAGSR